MQRRLVVCLGLLFACGGTGGDAQPQRLPQITSFGGPIMAHPRLVSIFYQDDPDIATLTSFSQWLVGSDWLTSVGRDYGVGSGTVLGIAQLPTAAPGTISDSQVVDLIYQALVSGAVPTPPDGVFGDVLYLLHIPPQTVETSGNQQSCNQYFGYHNSARRNGRELSYAIVASCVDNAQQLTQVQTREVIMSHELIEAATDPIPGNHPAFLLNDPASPWSSTEGEVADLCEIAGQPDLADSGFMVQRSWSNAAAQSGDPCVPVPTASPYYNLEVEGQFPPRIPPGGHQTFQLTGWATGKVPSWQLEAQPVMANQVTLTLGATTLNADQTATLDIAVPSTALVRSIVPFYVFSVMADGTYQTLPMRAIVGGPCAGFSGCEACTAQPGCGFCATTGFCENVGASGPADGACPIDAFAEGVGDCPGYCESHGGSCTECASQPGCGWCDLAVDAKCVGLDRTTLLPANHACSYEDWDLVPSYCPTQ